jgi:hypothetical protein
MNRMTRAGLAVVLLTLANGCLQSRLDESWGSSYEAQIGWQTADPDAPVSNEPLEGLDPETAERVAERYYEGQEQQRQRQAPSVLIGEF